MSNYFTMYTIHVYYFSTIRVYYFSTIRVYYFSTIYHTQMVTPGSRKAPGSHRKWLPTNKQTNFLNSISVSYFRIMAAEKGQVAE